MEVADGDEEDDSSDSDQKGDSEYSIIDDRVQGELVLEGDSTNELGAADPESFTLQEETEISQQERISTPVQEPLDTEDESVPEANESGDADEGRAARRKRLAARGPLDVKEIVVKELQKKRVKEEHRHHSKKGVGRAGRMKGSKAKQDSTVKKTDWEI